MKQYKLIIWDLDGTILNTLEDLASSTKYVLKVNGYPTRTTEEVRQFVGNGIGKLIERALPADVTKETYESVLQEFLTYYQKHCADTTKPYEGICELIQRLKDKGIRHAVVSNKADAAVQELCKQYFPGLFEFVVGERTGIRRKPYPDSVFEVLEQLQTAKEAAVYIGDSDVDIETAKQAGMDCISVTWGFRDAVFLKAHGASCLIDTPAQLEEYVSMTKI